MHFAVMPPSFSTSESVVYHDTKFYRLWNKTHCYAVTLLPWHRWMLNKNSYSKVNWVLNVQNMTNIFGGWFTKLSNWMASKLDDADESCTKVPDSNSPNVKRFGEKKWTHYKTYYLFVVKTRLFNVCFLLWCVAFGKLEKSCTGRQTQLTSSCLK